ncbi:MAG: hypothetical protein K1X83_03560 [Oligoflexia bacterium]|nr:hypothetical protein [Oligoflexia bacterium]
MFESLSALIMVGSGFLLIFAPLVSAIVALFAIVQLFRNRSLAKRLFLWAAGITGVPLILMLGTFLLRNLEHFTDTRDSVAAANNQPAERGTKPTLEDIKILLDQKTK